MKWTKRKATYDKSKDYNRHYRVALRLQLRLEKAADDLDIDRLHVLLNRIRRVRDIQIRDMGC